MRAWLTIVALGTSGMFLPGVQGGILLTVLPEPEILFTASLPDVRVPIDLDEDSVTDFTFGYFYAGVALRTERANRLIYYVDPPPNLGGPVQRLVGGFVIGSELGDPYFGWRSADLREGYVSPDEMAFVSIVLCVNTGCSSTWPRGEPRRGFIGLEFELDDGVHYGYFDVSVSGDRVGATLYGWAYESCPGVPILAGARPEILPLRPPRVVGEGFLRLEWPAEPGKIYQVQSKGSLSDPAWSDLGFALPAVMESLMVDLPARGAAQFCRVIEVK